MKDAMPQIVEDGNADMSFADDDKSISSTIPNDKILEERPLERSDEKLIQNEVRGDVDGISDSEFIELERLYAELEAFETNGIIPSDSEQ